MPPIAAAAAAAAAAVHYACRWPRRCRIDLPAALAAEDEARSRGRDAKSARLRKIWELRHAEPRPLQPAKLAPRPWPRKSFGGSSQRFAVPLPLPPSTRHTSCPHAVARAEPATGLDPLSARKVDELILRTRERFDVTSVVISHDMTQAFRLADCLHVLDKGRLVASGPPVELRAQPGSLAAQYFEASRPG
ncbi:MAG: hypothetical protein ABI895_15405 [Deltaproteobacteria bacterium]